jgi:hypothetical protein
VIVSGLVTLVPSTGGAAPLTDAVLGQHDPASVGCNQATGVASVSSLCAPSDVVMDPRTGRLFVADSGNYRVLSWANTHRLRTGEPADLVLGQPDFETAEPCDSLDAGCFDPASLSVDSEGRLYVVDNANDRVWGFSPPLVANMAADLVMTTTEFSTRVCNASPTPCHTPGAATDFRGDLFIADPANSRVLRSPTQAALGTQPTGGGTGTTIIVTTTEDEVTTMAPAHFARRFWPPTVTRLSTPVRLVKATTPLCWLPRHTR